MKTVKKTEEIFITVYEAIDGTQFESAQECEKYEKSARCVINAKFNNLKKQTFDSETITMGLCDNIVYIIKPESKSDVDVIAQYIAYKSGSICGDTVKRIQKAFEENKHLVVISNCDESYVWVECILEDYIEQLKTFI